MEGNRMRRRGRVDSHPTRPLDCHRNLSIRGSAYELIRALITQAGTYQLCISLAGWLSTWTAQPPTQTQPNHVDI
jgi:hypothetical protein